MAVGQSSQIAPVTGSIDDVSAWLEDIASRLIAQLDSGTLTVIRETIRISDDVPELRHAVESGIRYAILQWLLQSTLCEWYAHRGDLSLSDDGDARAAETRRKISLTGSIGHLVCFVENDMISAATADTYPESHQTSSR